MAAILIPWIILSQLMPWYLYPCIISNIYNAWAELLPQYSSRRDRSIAVAAREIGGPELALVHAPVGHSALPPR
jgi:hypothetical protein